MRKSNSVKILLMVSGVIGGAVGGALLVSPVAFEASAGIKLGDNISLLSEIRSSGGAILSTGFIVLWGAFVPKLRYVALLLSTSFYLSYGLSRVFSMVVDGLPNESLVVVTAFEIIIGTISFILFQKQKKIVN